MTQCCFISDGGVDSSRNPPHIGDGLVRKLRRILEWKISTVPGIKVRHYVGLVVEPMSGKVPQVGGKRYTRRGPVPIEVEVDQLPDAKIRVRHDRVRVEWRLIGGDV